MGNMPRIMVNATSNAAPTEQPAAVEAVASRNKAFTPEQLLEAWQAYIDQHPQERALSTTMSYAQPQQGEGNNYVMVVGSSTEQKNVEERKEALLKFLHDTLENDLMTLEVKVSDVPIDTPKILSPREVVEQIKQHNPNFTQFLKDFELGLG